MTPCDWNPTANAPADIVMVRLANGRYAPLDERRGCKEPAVVRVRHKGRLLALCAFCVDLPVFRGIERERMEVMA